MNLRTEHLARCLQTLEKSLEQLKHAPRAPHRYLVVRNPAGLDELQRNTIYFAPR